MTEKRFSNREIKLMFEGQSSKIDEIHTDVRSVLEQATRTNGRVGKLEGWQSFMRGGLAVLTVVLLPVLFMVVKIIIDRR